MRGPGFRPTIHSLRPKRTAKNQLSTLLETISQPFAEFSAGHSGSQLRPFRDQAEATAAIQSALTALLAALRVAARHTSLSQLPANCRRGF